MNPKFKRAPINSKLTTGGFVDKTSGELLTCGKFTKAECDEFNGVAVSEKSSKPVKKKGIVDKILG